MLRASTPEASGTQTSRSDTRIDSSLSTCNKHSQIISTGDLHSTTTTTSDCTYRAGPNHRRRKNTFQWNPASVFSKNKKSGEKLLLLLL